MTKKCLSTFCFFILFFILSLTAFASHPPEFRGVWIDNRSIPNTAEGIEIIVKRLAAANFNAILIESFYLGQTIYPSDFLSCQGLPQQMAVFAQTNFDPLMEFIKKAHQHSMQVHAWFDMFYVGLNQPGDLLNRFPSWQAINRDGTAGYTQGNNHFYWVCPLHQGVKEFYIGLISEAITKYRLDGIHLDYLRFPDTTIADTCYAIEHRDWFASQYGIDPANIDPLAEPEIYRFWNQYRVQSVTDLLTEINTVIHNQKPEVILSVAVQPRGMPIELNPGFLQDWPHWAEKHLLDVLIPMTYSSRANEMKGLAFWVNTFLLGNLPSFVGLQGFNLPDANTLAQQVEIARSAKFQGVSIFAYPYLTDELLTDLKNGPFRQKIQAPSRKFLTSLTPTEKVKVVAYTHPKPRIIHTHLINEEIHIDGQLKENSWKNADYQSNFSLITGEGLATTQTSVAALYSADNLFLAFQVEDSPAQKRKTTIFQKDGPVFYDDSVEAFIDPWLSRSFYYHLAVNSLGTQYDSFSRIGPSWNAQWQAAISEKDNGWVAELAIPFSELGIQAPTSGDQWGINFNRNDINSGEFSGWSPTPGTFHAPSFFGILQFDAQQ